MCYPPTEGLSAVQVCDVAVTQRISSSKGAYGTEWHYSLNSNRCTFIVRPFAPTHNSLEVRVMRFYPKKSGLQGAQVIDYILNVASIAAKALDAQNVQVRVDSCYGSWPFYIKCGFENSSTNTLEGIWRNRAMYGKVKLEQKEDANWIQEQEKLAAEYQGNLEKLPPHSAQIDELQKEYLAKGYFPFPDAPPSTFVPGKKMREQTELIELLLPTKTFRQWEALRDSSNGTSFCRQIGKQIFDQVLSSRKFSIN